MLTRYYGFTHEELDFIPNYDIKYRMGLQGEEDDGEPFEEKMQRLTVQWQEQVSEARKLDAAIEANLKELGYGG